MTYLMESHDGTSQVEILEGMIVNERSLLGLWGQSLEKENIQPMPSTSSNPCHLDEDLPISLPILNTDTTSVLIAVEPVGSEILGEICFQEASKIEQTTRKQRKCELWLTKRKLRFTASKFGLICKRKVFNAKFIEFFCEPVDISHVPQIQHGIQNEKKAIELYLSTCTNIKYYKCGLVIHPYAAHLGASPDGVVYHNLWGFGVVEVKCPSGRKYSNLLEACAVKQFCLEKRNNGFSLKRDSDSELVNLQEQELDRQFEQLVQPSTSDVQLENRTLSPEDPQEQAPNTTKTFSCGTFTQGKTQNLLLFLNMFNNALCVIGVGILGSIGVKNARELSPKAKALYKQACYYKKKMRRINKSNLTLKERVRAAKFISKESAFGLLSKNLSNIAFNFFKRQVESYGKSPKGRQFTTEDKVLALALYKKSPATYKLLASIFTLPSRITLQKLLTRILIKPGLNEAIFDGLKAVGKKMSAKNKICILIFDEMSICSNLQYNQHLDYVQGFEDFGTYRTQKITNHAQVYMLRGVVGNWRQPVAYTFVSGGMKGSDIENMIKNIVSLTKKAGFKIIATVCDQGSNNVQTINNIIKNTQRENKLQDDVMIIDGDIIIPLYDPPHLLKAVRNNLRKHDIHFEINGVPRLAKWNHIATAYAMDSFSGHLRCMPKLTDQHIDHRKINKMKVCYAAQVFSHSVASTMNLLIGNENFKDNSGMELDESARDTVEFIKLFDNIFDSVNGCSNFSKECKLYRIAMSTNRQKAVHEALWDTVLPVLNSMYILRDGKKIVVPCFKNWQLTLRGLRTLKNTLRSYGVATVKTRSFNQDPLENFFGRIRQRGQRSTNPTSTLFEQIYKSLLVNDLVSKHSMGFNCENDNTDLLVNLQQFVTQGISEDAVDDNYDLSTLSFPNTFQELNPLEVAALSYVSGYIVKMRSQLDIKCIACKYNILSRNEDDHFYNSLIKIREYGGKNLCRLKYCNVEFVKI